MSLPPEFVQVELFNTEDYELNENPMVRQYSTTWNGAKCRQCKSFDIDRQRCAWRPSNQHNPSWDACGQYRPKKEKI